jgi:hypothetical protein
MINRKQTIYTPQFNPNTITPEHINYIDLFSLYFTEQYVQYFTQYKIQKEEYIPGIYFFIKGLHFETGKYIKQDYKKAFE